MSFADQVARLALLPLILTQGLWVASRAIQLPEAAGDRSGIVGQGPDLRLLILGDSSAAGVGVETQTEALAGLLVDDLRDRHRVTWDVVAQSGLTTAGALRKLRDVPANQYDVVVIGLGVNDVKNGISLRRWLRLQTRLLDRLTDDFGACRIVVCGLPPMGRFPVLPQPLRWALGQQADRFDRAQADLLVTRDAVTRVEMVFALDETHMAADGFHPGPAIYAEWAGMIGKALTLDPEEVSA